MKNKTKSVDPDQSCFIFSWQVTEHSDDTGDAILIFRNFRNAWKITFSHMFTRGGGGHMAHTVTHLTFSESMSSLMFPDQVVIKDYEVSFNMNLSSAKFNHSAAVQGLLNDPYFSLFGPFVI